MKNKGFMEELNKLLSLEQSEIVDSFRRAVDLLKSIREKR